MTSYATLRWPAHLSLSPGFPVPWRAFGASWTRLEDGRLEVRYESEEELEACLLMMWAVWVMWIVELVRVLTEEKC